jgi:hypothetical protein
MKQVQFELSTVERWAYTTELDEEFDQYCEDDPDWLEVSIQNACSLEDIYRFTADRICLKRAFFAQLLIPNLCWIYRTNKELPFHFSRMQGIVAKEDYLSNVTTHAEAVYERCLIIERMRLSNDPALQALAKAMLDYRHELLEPKQKEYSNLLRSLFQNVAPLFENA